jgi:alpha-tubulin suppressor-like RCC1 family protein
MVSAVALCRKEVGLALIAFLGIAGCNSDPTFPDVTAVNWIDVTAGGFHSCAIAEDGTGHCWGSNSSGQLGTALDLDEVFSPVRVAGGVPLTQIDAGAAHTCAVTEVGGIVCWGDNQFGQVGDGTTEDRFRPVTVVASGSFAQISAGGAHTCALDIQGRASCWGRNDHGQLGRASAEVDRVPRPVETEVQFLSISAGTSHTCGVSLQAIAYCWGENAAGQLGVGSASDASVPIAVESASFRFRRVASGFNHSCAVTLGGDFACWGVGGSGQLGVGNFSTRTPIALDLAPNAVDVAVGGEGWSCGLVGSGEMWCWGLNKALGLADAVPAPMPGGLTGVERLGVGDLHVCALTEGGGVHCWGRGTGGQLGQGAFENSPVPLRVGG